MQVEAASHISHANHGSHASASRVEALVVQLSVGDTARGGDGLRENEVVQPLMRRDEDSIWYLGC